MPKKTIEEVLTELKINYRSHVRYIEVICPSHEDHHPSLKIWRNGWAHCYVCGYSKPFSVVVKDLKSEGYKQVDFRKVVYTKSNDKKDYKPFEYPLGYKKFEGEVPELCINKEMIDIFNIGYCSNGFRTKVGRYCKGCYFNDKNSDENRWVTKYNYCNFARNRIMIPVTMGGRLYSIESRDLSGKAYKKVIYPNNSRISRAIFNRDNLNPDEPVFIVEGIKGALRFWRDFNRNVTAIFSNRLKGDQTRILSSYSRYVIVPDLGEAGEMMIEDIIRIAKDVTPVMRFPKVLLCKNCGKEYRGEEKKDICPNCKGDKVGFKDVFDFKISQIKESYKEAILNAGREWEKYKSKIKENKLERVRA
jgi:DNA primase